VSCEALVREAHVWGALVQTPEGDCPDT